MRDFDIPDSVLATRVHGARMIGPSARTVRMPIENGFVGMVDRDTFDEWLRARAASAGAERCDGTFVSLERQGEDTLVSFRPRGTHADAPLASARARVVIGADGATSKVAEASMPDVPAPPFVYAYHEIIRAPDGRADYEPGSCDVLYDGRFSPDFYGWVFPHGPLASVGVGTAERGLSLRASVARLRARMRLDSVETVRREGAPIPLKPRDRWDDGHGVVLAGDAAGVVAPASGEGIYYAMSAGRFAAEAAAEACRTGDAKALGLARRRFMKAHGKVFFILGVMQRYWYANDARRERFVGLCRDPDIQSLTWDAYMNKELVRARPMAHARIFFKNLAHLAGVVPA